MEQQLFQDLSAKDYNSFDQHLGQAIKDLEKTSATLDPKEKVKQVEALNRIFNQGRKFLPTHTQQQHQNALQKLLGTPSSKASKFSFNAKLKPAKVQQAQQQSQAEAAPDMKWTIENLTNEIKEITCDGSMVALNNLENCRIIIVNDAPSINLNNMKNCVFIAESVAGSSYITNCHNCRFVIRCHQLRIHLTTETDFYIDLPSNPIIEKCEKVRFAPINAEPATESWSNVQDFSDPTKILTEPNWSIIPEEMRKIPKFNE